tara:strand:- start:790 stop:1986 length:1197 start_codon:yes stop_codon:yes gene_type:complete
MSSTKSPRLWEDPKSGTFYIRHYANGKRKRFSTGTKERAIAEAELRQFKLDQAHEDATPHTLCQAMERHQTILKPGNTLTSSRSAAKRIAKAGFDLPLAEVTSPMLAKLTNAIVASGCSASTAESTIKWARAAWRHCQPESPEIGEFPPLPKVTYDRLRKQVRIDAANKRRAPTPAETTAILKEVEGRLSWLPLTLLAVTGARLNEVAQLRQRDLDRDGCRFFTTTKTGDRVAFDIPPGLMAQIPTGKPNAPVCPGRNGAKPITASGVLMAVKRAAKQLGLPDADRLDVHSFRCAVAVELGRAEGFSMDDVKGPRWRSGTMASYYQSRAGTSKGAEAAALMASLYGVGGSTQKATQMAENGLASSSCAVERPAEVRLLQRFATPLRMEEIECESRAGT